MSKPKTRGTSFWDTQAEKVLSVTPSTDGRQVLVCAASADGEPHHVVTIRLDVEQALQLARAIEQAGRSAAENDDD